MLCDLNTGLPDALRTTPVTRLHATVSLEDVDTIAEETPVALVFNGISHVVMMATPFQLEDFGIGFALSEGIVASLGECRDVDVVAGPLGIQVQLTIAPRAMSALKARRRTLEGRTGCGLCGVDSLQALDLQLPQVPSSPTPSLASVTRAFAALPKAQALHQQSGGCHAAAWAATDGTLRAVREDVGRHNALDKLIGHRAAASARSGTDGFVVLSSRASYELVAKCARAGIGTLATASAPTALAIRVAQAAGLRLLGFCRDGRAVEYTSPAMQHPDP